MLKLLYKILIALMCLTGFGHTTAQNFTPQANGSIIIRNLSIDESIGTVRLSFQAEVIDKSMSHRQNWTIVPELISASGEHSSLYPNILINGKQTERHNKRKMKYNDRKLLNSQASLRVSTLPDSIQIINYSAELPLETWMENSTLILHKLFASSHAEKQLFSSEAFRLFIARRRPR